MASESMVGRMPNLVRMYVFRVFLCVIGCGGRNDLTERCTSDGAPPVFAQVCMCGTCALFLKPRVFGSFVCREGACLRGEESAQCRTDNDCVERCSTCVPVAVRGVVDCPEGQVCSDERLCVERCNSALDCEMRHGGSRCSESCDPRAECPARAGWVSLCRSL